MYAMYVCMFNTQLCKKYSYGKKTKKKKTNPGQNFSLQKP